METQPLRFGIIGTGMMGLEHQRNLAALPGAVVTAFSDPTPTSLEWARAEVGGEGVTCFSDHRDLLTSGLVDAVVIASPNMTHRAIAADVIASGLHVLIEKPLALTTAECRELLEIPTAPGQVVAVGLEYRYMPPVAELISLVRGGAVGEPKMVSITEHRFPFLVKVGDWNRFNENTGGTLVEKCCHFFDLMNLLTGANPVRVMASGAQDVNHLDERYDGRVPDILDNGFVIVDYDNGMRCALDLCMFAEGSEEQEELSVVGTLGKVEAFLPSSTVRVGQRSTGRGGVITRHVVDDSIGHEGFHHGASFVEHRRFIEAIRGGTAPEVTLLDGLRAVAIGEAAQIALAEHRVVELSEVGLASR